MWQNFDIIKYNIIFIISNYSIYKIKYKWHSLSFGYSGCPSFSAEAASERLGSSRYGTSRLRNFHFIEFCSAIFRHHNTVFDLRVFKK